MLHKFGFLFPHFTMVKPEIRSLNHTICLTFEAAFFWLWHKVYIYLMHKYLFLNLVLLEGEPFLDLSL